MQSKAILADTFQIPNLALLIVLRGGVLLVGVYVSWADATIDLR